MDNLSKFLVCFGTIIFLKFFINASKYISAKRMRDQYTASFTKNGKPFTEQIPIARKLFSDAGLSKVTIPVTQSLGYGQLTSFHAKVIDNLDCNRQDIVSSALSLFDQMVGMYRMRMLESFSLRYWLELLIFLPKYVVQYLGGNAEKLPAKLFQLSYWFIAPLLVTFRADLYEFIIALLERA